MQIISYLKCQNLVMIIKLIIYLMMYKSLKTSKLN